MCETDTFDLEKDLCIFPTVTFIDALLMLLTAAFLHVVSKGYIANMGAFEAGAITLGAVPVGLIIGFGVTRVLRFIRPFFPRLWFPHLQTWFFQPDVYVPRSHCPKPVFDRAFYASLREDHDGSC